MKYDEVSLSLVNAFPDFVIDEVNEGLPYCIAGSFAHYLLDAYKNNSFDVLTLAGEFIEALYSHNDGEIDDLATVGYLEAIQNVWGNNSVDPEEMVKYLGNTSQKWWVKLNSFWNGDISSLQICDY